MNRVTIEHGPYKIVLEHPENDGGWTAEQVVERLVRPAMLGLTYTEGTLLAVLGPENDEVELDRAKHIDYDGDRF